MIEIRVMAPFRRLPFNKDVAVDDLMGSLAPSSKRLIKATSPIKLDALDGCL